MGVIVGQGSTPPEPRRRMSANQVFSLQLSYGAGDSGCNPSHLIRADFASVGPSACSLGDPACVPVTNLPQFGSLQKGSCVSSLQFALDFNQSYALITQFGDAICGSLSETGGIAVPVGVCSPRMASSTLLTFASPVKADLVSTNAVTGRLQYSTFADAACSTTTVINTVQFDSNNNACDQQRSIKLVTFSSSLQPQSPPPPNTASVSAPVIFASTTLPSAQSTNAAIMFSESNGPSLTLIVGVSVGGTVCLIIFTSLTVICFLRHRRSKLLAPSSSARHRYTPTESSESAPLIPLTHASPYGTRSAAPSLPQVERTSPIPERYSMIVGKAQNRSAVTWNTSLSNQTELSSEAEKEAVAPEQQQKTTGVPLPKGDAESMETGATMRPGSAIRAMPRNSVKFQLKVNDWSVDEVAEWVARNDWPDETVKLVQDLGINGADLLNLTDEDLFEGLLLSNKEQRTVFLKEVDDLRRK